MAMDCQVMTTAVTGGARGNFTVVGQRQGEAATEGCATEPKCVPSGLRQMPYIADTYLAASATKQATAEDLHAEIALLKQQLMEVRRFVLQSVQAPAMACSVDAEEVQMQNRELLKTVKELREENAILLEIRQALEQTIEEVQAQNRYNVTCLLDDIENLKIQLSKQHLRCNDAQEQRDAQKQLFLKLFMLAKHDMEQSNTQNNTQHAKAFKHAMLEHYSRIAAKRAASPLDKKNEAAPIHCTDDNFKNHLAHAKGTQIPRRDFAEHHLVLPASKLDGKVEVSLPHLTPVSSAQSHTKRQRTNSTRADE